MKICHMYTDIIKLTEIITKHRFITNLETPQIQCCFGFKTEWNKQLQG